MNLQIINDYAGTDPSTLQKMFDKHELERMYRITLSTSQYCLCNESEYFLELGLRN